MREIYSRQNTITLYNVDNYYDDKFTPVTQTNSVSQGLSSTQTDSCKKLESLKLITNNTEVLATKANYEPKSKLSLSETELDYAKIAIDSQMSKAVFRSSMITTTQKALDKQHETGDHIIIKTKTLDNLFYHVDNQAGDFMVGLQTKNINVNDLLTKEGFKHDDVDDFTDAYSNIELVYQNILSVCEYLLSYKEYWHDTKLRSEILMRGNNRVYQDISSGKWCNNNNNNRCFLFLSYKEKLPIGAIVLGVILSSDATGVSGNTRFKSYPLYCKLANTPNYIHNKATSGISRVLAFLPTLDCPQEGKNRPHWTEMKNTIIHHYMYIIDQSKVNKNANININFDTFNSTLNVRGPFDKMYKCVPALAAYIADMPEH
ncbi:hypothetical protein INT45_001344 [Circinella minor]|uniref:Uncharacterized protein n=1 Tax=Circinella minor TaxID=1195481 RepID=A0A8H7RRY8_9FUNG|nr:hypothetical protein INT45_001344 [Circinella minor]